VNTVKKFDFDPQQSKPIESPSFDAQEIYTTTRSRLVSNGTVSEFDLQEHLELLDNLMAFSLGRFWLQNHQLNGHWYNYIMRTYVDFQVSNTLERKILYNLPLVLAKRQSFKTIQAILQQNLQNGLHIASAPCGGMGDILTLDYQAIKNIHLTAIDSDFQSIVHAGELAEEKGLSTTLSFFQADLKALNPEDAYHILIHHAWTMGNFSKNTIRPFLHQCFKALQPGGLFISNFPTCSPEQSKDSPWNMSVISPEMLRLQNLLLSQIIRHVEEPTQTLDSMADSLKEVGFSGIEFIPDDSKMIITVLAKA
jgi:hypothetical protein